MRRLLARPDVRPFLLGGAVILAFCAGWRVNGWRHGAALNSQAEKVRTDARQQLDTLRRSLDASRAERLSLAADLAAAKTHLNTNYLTLSREVPTHALPNTDACPTDLSPGLVGLLNTAAGGGTVHPGRAAKPARQRPDPVSGPIADPAD